MFPKTYSQTPWNALYCSSRQRWNATIRPLVFVPLIFKRVSVGRMTLHFVSDLMSSINRRPAYTSSVFDVCATIVPDDMDALQIIANVFLRPSEVLPNLFALNCEFHVNTYWVKPCKIVYQRARWCPMVWNLTPQTIRIQMRKKAPMMEPMETMRSGFCIVTPIWMDARRSGGLIRGWKNVGYWRNRHRQLKSTYTGSSRR